jgi:hypothetical protein
MVHPLPKRVLIHDASAKLPTGAHLTRACCPCLVTLHHLPNTLWWHFRPCYKARNGFNEKASLHIVRRLLCRCFFCLVLHLGRSVAIVEQREHSALPLRDAAKRTLRYY